MLNDLKKRTVPILLLITFIYASLLAQDSAKPVQPTTDVGVSFEEAMKKMEAQRAEERRVLTQKYKEKLSKAINTWISQKEIQKKSEMNEVIDQNWDKLPKEYNFNMLHYDYYLRGYNYSIASSEIRETQSLTAPIKAQAVITEKVYAEKYHTPDISNVDPYFFTVTTAITLDMEYHQDDFVTTGTGSKIVSIVNDCPPELKKMKI